MTRIVVTVLLALSLVAALAVSPPEATAQQQITLTSANAYANSTADTLLLPQKVKPFTVVDIFYYFRDSVSTKIYLDIREPGASAWTLKDSVSVTSEAAIRGVWTLRDGIVGKWPGTALDARLRNTHAGSANGVSTATWDCKVYFTK